MYKVKRDYMKNNAVTLELPSRFSFRDQGIFEFSEILDFFDWSLHDSQVKIDMTTCHQPNYQTLALLMLYVWKLKDQGCKISFNDFDSGDGAGSMWRRIGGRGAMDVLLKNGVNFITNDHKPMFALRNNNDFKNAIECFENYIEGFNVEYTNTLRYVLSELLYNTLEHGICNGSSIIHNRTIPSVIQFTWYQKSNQIHFIVADIGIGIKRHLEKTYPGQSSDEEAIRLAIQPKKSGTFGETNLYKDQNNAGMGLYLSTNIIRRLKANMHILSGNGLLHISPRDITSKTLESSWPGTIAFIAVEMDKDFIFNLHSIMQEFRDKAKIEQKTADVEDKNDIYYVGIYDFFGAYAEDKEAAIKFRNNKLFPSIEENKTIRIDFINVISSPHSFLSALLASPIKSLGLIAHKRIKIVNAIPEIRETIDFIFDDNTD